MTSLRLGVLSLTAAWLCGACSGSGSGPGGAGAGGMGATGGSGATGGNGATGGSPSSLSVSLKTSSTELEPGQSTELSWTAQNATSCQASGGWSGEKSAEGDTQQVPVFRETTYTMTCVDASSEEASSSVTVFVTGRLLATVAVGPNPAKGGERALATVTVSNPSEKEVKDVEVEVKIPEHVDPLTTDDLSPGFTCTGSCSPGDFIKWFIGTLQPGQVVTFFIFPTVSISIPPGTTLSFDLTLTATDEPIVQKSGSTKEGERPLALSLEGSASKVWPGEEIDYSLHYSNPTGGVLENVVIILVLPLGTELTTASPGASMTDAQTVEWEFAELQPRQGGTLKVAASADPMLPPGAQLLAKAEGEVSGQRALATTLTSLSEDPLTVSNQVSPDRVQPGERLNVAVTASNRSLATIQDVGIAVRTPEGIDPLFDSELSAGGSCPGGSCSVGELATWSLGDLAAGESVTVSMVPVASSSLPAFVLFEALVSLSGALSVQSSSTAVAGDRSLELRLSESDNPVRPGQALGYTLHLASQNDTTVNGSASIRVPTGTSFLRASDDGAADSDGLVTWPIAGLLPGTGTTRRVEVRVDPTLPLGSQLRADASASISGSTEEARATKHTPVSATSLKASVDVNPDPTKSAERTLVQVTVSNPGTEPANDVVVDLRVPQYLDTLDATELSGDGVCLGGSFTACDTASWDLGTVDAGASTTLTLPPVVASTAPNGALLSFNAEVRATDETPVLATATTVVDDARPLELHLSQSQNPVSPGTVLIYTLHFGNQSGATLSGFVTLTIPEGTMLVSVSDDGVFDAQKSLATWGITELQPGEGGSRQLAVAVDDDLAEGSQLRALATAVVGDNAGDRARATAVNPLTETALIATVDVAPDPVGAGQAGLVSVAVSNPSASLVSDVTVDVRIPQQLESLLDGQLSTGGSCPGGACTEGERASWSVGALAPGESTTVSFPPVVSSSADDGALIPFEATVKATDEAPLIASATTLVNGQRPLALRVDDGGYPVAPGDPILYVLHFGNLSGTPLNGTATLTVPDGTTFKTASDGGAESSGVVTWPIMQLPPDGVGSRTLAVDVDDTTPVGSQLRTLATATVGAGDGNRVLATEHTPVAISPLSGSVLLSDDPVEPSDAATVSVMVTNVSASPLNDVAVALSIPQGLNTVFDADLSAGGSCPGGSCTALERAIWSVGTLNAAQSATVSFAATVASTTSGGSLLPFEAEVTSAGVALAGASATLSICSGAGCPAQPPPPDLLVCGGGGCFRHDSDTGTQVGAFTLYDSVTHCGDTGLFPPLFDNDGILWLASKDSNNSVGNRFCRYDNTGTLIPPSFTLPAAAWQGPGFVVNDWTVTHAGKIFAAVRDANNNPRYVWQVVVGSAVAPPQNSAACGGNDPPNALVAAPADPADPPRETGYAVRVAGGVSELIEFDFSFSPPSCAAVALVGDNDPATDNMSQTVAPQVSRIRLGPDGSIYLLAAHGNPYAGTDEGIWRITPARDVEQSLAMCDLLPQPCSGTAYEKPIIDFAVHPTNGNLYVLAKDDAPFQRKLEVFDPQGNSLGVLYQWTDVRYSLEFFPTN